MSAIAKTIWLIESRLFEDISLDDVAEHAGLSRSHISRAFPAATGFSISGYMRSRRLSEAARQLARGAPDILSVALDVHYGSHEAFTRAFRELFGTTPEEVRREGGTGNLKLMEPLPMDPQLKLRLDPPTIDNHARMLMCGIRGRHGMSAANTLPLQWQRFQPHLGTISGQVGRVAYGVVGEMPEGADDFEYFTAVEIDGKGALPSDLVTVTIPAQRFARYRHHGHISSIRSTVAAIFEVREPTLGQSSAFPYSFVEYYGPGFDPIRGEGDVEIWVPEAT
jgi:AraC family transcriptional regulator